MDGRIDASMGELQYIYPLVRESCSVQFGEETGDQKLQRQIAWRDPDCKQIYYQLIKRAGGYSAVRTEMRMRAIQLAIMDFINGRSPDYESFRANVKKTNEVKPLW